MPYWVFRKVFCVRSSEESDVMNIYKASLLIIFCLVVPSIEASAQQKEALDGHLKLYFQEGIQTPVYGFVHPETGTRVTLSCVNHVGKGSYFDYIKRSLAGCDTVIYEDSDIANKVFTESDLEEASKLLKTGNQNKAGWVKNALLSNGSLFMEFVKSIYTSYIIAATASGCEFESVELESRRNLDNWVSGGKIIPDDPEKQKVRRQEMDKAFLKCKDLPAEVLADQVWDIKIYGLYSNRARKDKSVKFTTRNFSSVLDKVYTAKEGMSLYQEMYLNPVEESMMKEIFDPLVANSDNPKKLHIGIKYGVEHATRLTELLTSRGFELKKTTWLVSIPLKFGVKVDNR